MVGVVAALGAEARTLGHAGGIAVRVSGIGPEAASRTAGALADAGATALVSWGVAGGLDPALRPGAIVLPAAVIDDGGRRYPTTAAWRERQDALLGPLRRPVSGDLLSLAAALAGAPAKARAFRATGAVAVDMESLAIAAVASARGLPFLAVRVIVDAAEDELPQAVVAASAGGGLRLGRLATGLLSSPSEIAALWRLARRFGTARGCLRRIARAGLAAPFP